MSPAGDGVAVAARGGAAFAELGARSNFSLLDGASHPEEMVGTAAALGLAGLAVCDTNSLAGVVRAHVAAKQAGLRFAVGARLLLDDGAQYLVWPTDRASYGRLTRLLSLGRTRAPKGACAIDRDDLLDAAEGWAMALLPPQRPDAAFADRLRADAADLRDRLALPLFCAAVVPVPRRRPEAPRHPGRHGGGRGRRDCWPPTTRASTTPPAAASPTC